MKEFKIGNRFVGENHPIYIITEAGCNHDGKLEQGFRLIEEAAKNGADAIKFQTFKAGKLVTKTAEQWWLPEEQRQGKKQIDLYKIQDTFGFDEYKALQDHCNKNEIMFLSTPFDEESADLLERLNVPAYKIASTDLTNLPFLEYVAKKQKPMIISVGMSFLEEIAESVETIRSTGNEQISLLHCIVEYPAPMNHANLNFIKTLQKKFPDYVIGFSDHTLGYVADIVATSFGAKIIEKHFTIDKTIRGAPDHIISVDPKELSGLVKDIRAAETSLGSYERNILEYEISAREFGRRKLVANTYIPKDTIIERYMVTSKRNDKGLYPKFMKDVLGKKAKVDLNEDDAITFEKLY
ncbi:MAG: N-acetylneuraminate synthase family protein [Nanoarchaeota archaeon]